MLSLLSELHFWTTDENVSVKATDYGVFKYYLKKDVAESLLVESKKTYCEQRGVLWIPPNKRPSKLKDKLRDLEEHFAESKVVATEWRDNKLQLLFAKGVFATILVNARTGDPSSLSFSKQLATKLQSETIIEGVIKDQQIICTTSDGRVLGLGSQWKDGWTLDAGNRKFLSLSREHLAVWGKAVSDHPQPWSPLRRDHEKANLHLYWVGARGPELLAYKKTDGEPISIVVSVLDSKTLIVVEQKVTQRGAVSIDVNSFELIGDNLKRVSITSVPLQTQVNCCRLSADEERLLLTCIDGTVALLNRNRGSTITIKASFIPKFAAFHTSGAVLVIANERGQLQYFDTALNSVPTQTVAEDIAPSFLTDLSSYFGTQITVDDIFWGPKDVVVAVEGGPMILVTHLESSLSFAGLACIYLASGKVEKAISLLLSWEFNEQSVLVLQKVCVQLMKEPLTEGNAKFLEDALGCYHNSAVPICVEMRHKFGAQVNALTRRFFHQLVRTGMFETAFLLSVDLGHHDLFMDLHFVAIDIGETEMASAARAQASALLSRCSSEESLCSRSSCSQCCDTESCSSEDCISQENPPSETPQIPTTTNDNFLTTNFNNPDPKTYKPSPVPVTAPPIPTIDLPKLPPKAAYVKPPQVPLLSVKYSKPQMVAPPLPFATLPTTNLNCTPISSNSVVGSTRTFPAPSGLHPNFSTSAFSPLRTNRCHNFPAMNVPKAPSGPPRSAVVPPPLPVTPSVLNKKQQAKVKFSDTVTAFIVPEVKRPARPVVPSHLTNPQKELADSLPLCHPNEDYLKDFAPIKKSEPNEVKMQPKIKVVHFGVV